MFGGFLVFNADTGASTGKHETETELNQLGAPVFHRRFELGFGLPIAERQPSLADPVGLALQLFAFSRFSDGLPGAPKLESLRFGRAGTVGDIFLSSASLPDPIAKDATLRLTLVVFGDLTAKLGSRLSKSLLQDFAEENVTSIQVLHPEQNAEPSPGKTTWHFHTLDSSLESVVDWLADDVARALPNFPPWLCVLRFDQEKTRNKLNIGHVEVGTPRPPAEPPASARGRPKSFARRLLHQFQGLASAATGTPRAKSEDTRVKKSVSENDGDAARGQPAKWLGRGPSPETEYFALTAFMYEGPEGCEKEPLPAKTSEPVLEAAKCLLTPKLKGAGWTLLEPVPESWLRRSSQDCHFCLALTVGSSRSHIVMPLNAVHEGTTKELNSLDSASLNQICASVRRKLDAEVQSLILWLSSPAGSTACGVRETGVRRRSN
ncbi:unnamed protein product [Symbiodinium sp. CCMP2456]|nr:unnamed protein product [Symbiodinium sp. CCMP2456]